MTPRKHKPSRAYKREKCPYDGTVLYDGAACPKCAVDIAQHLSGCWRCAGDVADLERRDIEEEAAS